MMRFVALIFAALTLLGCTSTASAFPPMPGTYGGAGNNPVAPLTVAISPSAAAATYSSSGTYTTNSATATASGGSGGYTYQWSYVSGSLVPTVNSRPSATTTWSAIATYPNPYNSVWKVKITDSSFHTAIATIPVQFTASSSPLTITVNPTAATASFTTNGSYTSNSVTATAAGGVSPYGYNWTYVSGAAGPAANTASLPATTWTDAATAPNTDAATWLVTATDALLNTASVQVPVTFTYVPPPLIVSVSPSVVGVPYSTGGLKTTASSTATGVNCVGSCSYVWTYAAGDSTIAATAANSATTAWSRTVVASNSYSATWTVTATDTALRTAAANVTVNFTAATVPLTVSVSPSGASVSYASSGPQTTNTVTATATGGAGGNSFAWTYVSGDAAATATAAASPATAWTQTVTSPTTYNSSWKVTVTDSALNTATATVPVSFTAASGFPLNVLAHGIVMDNFMQTAFDSPSTGSGCYVQAPKVVFGNAYVTSGSYADKDATHPDPIVTLTIPSSTVILPGTPVMVSGLTGSSGVAANFNGSFVAAAGTNSTASKTTLKYIVPSVGSQTINACAGTLTTPDMANFVAAGITYVRIFIDVEQIVPGIPYPVSYLSAITATTGLTYNSGTGAVSMTMPAPVAIPAPTTTTASATAVGVSTVTVPNSPVIVGGACISDTSNLAATGGATVPTQVGSVTPGPSFTTLTLIEGGCGAGPKGPYTIPSTNGGIVSGHTLAITYNLVITGSAGDCTSGTCGAATAQTIVSPTVINVDSAAQINVGAVVADVTTPSAIPSTPAPGTTVTKIVGNQITLSQAVSVAQNDALSFNDANLTTGINGSWVTDSGTGGLTVNFTAMPGLRVGHLTKIRMDHGVQPLDNKLTATAPGTSPGTGGCPLTYVSSACVIAFNLNYLDTLVSQFTRAGIAVDLVPVTLNLQPGAKNQYSQEFLLYASYAGQGSVTGNLHMDMGEGPTGVGTGTTASYGCYTAANGSPYVRTSAGTTCYEGMIRAANLVLFHRYTDQCTAICLSPSQFFPELHNEPDYKCDNAYFLGCPAPLTPINVPYQNPAIWNQAIIDITAAIRGVETGAVPAIATHTIISGGISSSKAQNFAAMVPTGDVNTVYSVHKYDPLEFMEQGTGTPVDPYMLYPREGTTISDASYPPCSVGAVITVGVTPSCAIGRPSLNGRPVNSVPQFIPPLPVPSSDTYGNGVFVTGCTDSQNGNVAAVWNAGQVLTASKKQACVPGGGGATSFVDYYDGTKDAYERKIDDFWSNAADGLEYATCWAQDSGQADCAAPFNTTNGSGHSGHTGALAGSSLKLIVGEFGANWSNIDRRSGQQFLYDLIWTFNHHGVAGGQTTLPWDFWSLDGGNIGVRPKGGATALAASGPGGPGTGTNYCLGTTGALAGYDVDVWAELQATQPAVPSLICTGNQYNTPGLP